MALRVWTARLTYSGADRLDVTRAAPPTGIAGPFAPSWGIIKTGKAAQSRAARLIGAERERVIAAAWREYSDAYTAEMRLSYTQNRREWNALMARREVTLCCFCARPELCHRTVLAGILVKLGAEYLGERG